MLAKASLVVVALGIGVAGVAVARPVLFATSDCAALANFKRTGNHQHWSPYNPLPCNTTACDAGQGACTRLSAFTPEPGGNGKKGFVTVWCRCDSEPADPHQIPIRCAAVLSAKAKLGDPLGPWTGTCVTVVCPVPGEDCLPDDTGLPSDELGAGWQVVICKCKGPE